MTWSDFSPNAAVTHNRTKNNMHNVEYYKNGYLTLVTESISISNTGYIITERYNILLYNAEE